MSKINGYNKSACAYESQIVSYLYDETDFAEKKEFESHIGKCAACADEVAAFGNVRFSIAEWREVEFSSMETPFVQVPKAQISQNKMNNSGKFAAIFESFRNFPGFSNTWAAAGAAFAILVIFFGFGFVIFNFSNGEELAFNSNRIEEKTEIEREKIAVDNSAAEDSSEDFAANSVVVSPEKNLEIVNNPAEKESPKNRVITEKTIKDLKKADKNKTKQSKNKTINNQIKTPSSIQTANESKKPKINPIQQKPSLTNFAEEPEDDSLRLADLFDEVETK